MEQCIHCSVQTADGNALAHAVSRLGEERFLSRGGGEGSVEGDGQAQHERQSGDHPATDCPYNMYRNICAMQKEECGLVQ